MKYEASKRRNTRDLSQFLVRNPKNKLPRTEPGPCGEESLPQCPNPFVPDCSNQTIKRISINNSTSDPSIHHARFDNVSRAAQNSRAEPRTNRRQCVRVYVIIADTPTQDKILGMIIARQLPHVYQKRSLCVRRHTSPEPEETVRFNDFGECIVHATVQKGVCLHSDLHQVSWTCHNLQIYKQMIDTIRTIHCIFDYSGK